MPVTDRSAATTGRVAQPPSQLALHATTERWPVDLWPEESLVPLVSIPAYRIVEPALRKVDAEGFVRLAGSRSSAQDLPGTRLVSAVLEGKAAAGLEPLGLTVARERLDATAQKAAAEKWSYSHFLGFLLEGGLAFRHEKAVRLTLQFANVPYTKRLEHFDFSAQPGVDRRIIDELATGRFLAEGRNLVFLGPPGVGKTH